MNEVTSLPPVASGAFYTMETFWAAAGVAGTVLVGLLAMWTAFRSSHPKRRLNYTVRHWPLVQQCADGSLETTRHGTLLTDPHTVEVVLNNPGRWDIPSEAFDRGDPFLLDLDVPYLVVMEIHAEPSSAVAPDAEVRGSRLCIGPGLIGRGTTITYVLLVDTAPVYAFRHSLVDVKVRQVSVPPPRRTIRPPLMRTP
ncbi:hypothetical protein [Streptomyces sp. NPDC093568]|uniref:hypothetical protein n=1 Tax=Streptomyces sp. NPDC093568 TaxID=3366041 RepID=UPI00382D004F